MNTSTQFATLSIGGKSLPPVGIGTRGLTEKEAKRLVAHGLATGYRYIDTSPIYGNEAAIGRVMRASGLPREAVFVATKVELTDLSPSGVEKSAHESLKALATHYLDLLMIHWPNPAVPLQETLSAMADLQRRGLVRNIGVANFPTALLGEAISIARSLGTSIATDQSEIHPSLHQPTLVETCRKAGVLITAYAALGKSDVDLPLVRAIAQRHGKTAPQIILRWHFQRGIMGVPVPDKLTEAQMDEHFALDFMLDNIDMAELSGGANANRYFNPAQAPAWDA